jgi:signal transduction histidine kinase/ActR/RegA family two-component response regulator
MAAMLAANHRQVLAKRVAIEFEEIISDSSGHRVYASVKAPLFDGSEPHGIVGVSTDITERKRLEDALREADRRKDEFLAMLAHELRNPIAPIRYALEVVSLKGVTTPDVGWAIGVVERQTKHMARLIDDLLDVNRITRNTLELRRERIDFSRVINSAIETSRPVLEANGCELTVVAPPEPIYVDGDIVRLAQVFANLLNNSAKYGKSDSGRSRVMLTVEVDATTVSVSVKDFGIGMSPSLLHKVFDMFSQAGRSRQGASGGLGIGLSLAKRLVEMHDGTIEAHSDGLGKGSKLTVVLPTAPAAVEASAVVPDTSGEQRVGQRILIADDNADLREVFEVMLKTLGHDVQTACNGLEVMERAELFMPEVIVLDIGMPKLNGYETARRIRRQAWGRNVVLIAISGWGDEKDKRRSQEAGFNVHLVKPVDPVSLGKLLNTLGPDQIETGASQ